MALQAQPARIDSSIDSRGTVRRRLILEVGAQAAGYPARPVCVYDISETGVLIETGSDLVVGDSLEVELPHAGSRVAEVIWQSGDLVGCKFLEELTSGAVSAALLRGRSLAPAPNAVQIDPGFLDQHKGDQPGTLSFRAKTFITLSLSALLWVLIAAVAVLIF